MKKILPYLFYSSAILVAKPIHAQWNLFGPSVRLNNPAWNVGIGINDPATKLDVNTTAAGQHAIRAQIGAVPKFLVASNGGTAIGVIALPPANGLYVSGFAGIGTRTPERRLHVFNGSAGVVTANANSPLVVENSVNSYINVLAPAANERGILFGDPANAQDGGVVYVGSTNAMHFRTNGNATRMTLTATGFLGIGTTLPERRLHVFNGSAGVVTANLNAPLVVENSVNSYINVLAPAASERGILFGDPVNAQDGGVIYVGSTNALHFRTNGNITRMTLSSAGNLDITGGNLSFGSVETFADAGANTISSNSNFIPTTDNRFDLGSSTRRWNEVWAADGTINTSDERDKTNIKDLDYGIKEIMKMRSTRFTWKDRETGNGKLGLIAQEVQKVLPEVVRDWEYNTNEETGTKEKVPSARLGIMYADIIPVLIKGMQEQQTSIETKDNQINELKTQVDQLKTKLDELYNLMLKKGLVGGNEITNAPVKGFLQLNAPNPFSVKTTIRYGLPQGTKGQINIYNSAGSLVKTLITNESGQSELSADGLKAGTYSYSLYADGKLIGTQKMLVVK